MENQEIKFEKIISRLELFDYNYEVKGKSLKIFLPMLCYLKINNQDGIIKITSRLSIGFRFLPIELNFLIYGLILYCLTWFQWSVLNKGVFALFGIFIIYLVVCFIKLESLRTMVHNWIEKDS
jgi:hypothetical protein